MRDKLIDLIVEANKKVKDAGFEFNALIVADFLMENEVVYLPLCEITITPIEK